MTRNDITTNADRPAEAELTEASSAVRDSSAASDDAVRAAAVAAVPASEEPRLNGRSIPPAIYPELREGDTIGSLLIEEVVVEPPKHEGGKRKRTRSQKLNMVLIILAFAVLFGYLFIAGEGTEVLDAVARFSYPFLIVTLVLMVVYWLLEAVCMQMLVTHLRPGFPFLRQFLNTMIGQYFNCITPLSSGGQPMQAYYYQRFGLPLSEGMTTLLCRFIVYQMTTTVYCAIVLILRFTYFTEQLAPVMTLVVIGFIGGLVLMAMLLALAFWRSGTTKFAMWGLRLLGKVHILKDPEAAQAEATKQLDDAYNGVHRLLTAPKLLFKVAAVTFVQLTVFFSVSYAIYLGFGLEGSDFLTVISCQAFVYMISSFIPLPGAVGAAEGSYIAFFSYIYPDGGLTAYSTFIWRLFTFYLPILIGMYITVAVNNPKSWLARHVGMGN